MRLDDDGDRSNVEDRRGQGSTLGGTGVRLGVGGTVVVLLLSIVLKQDLFSMLSGPAPGPATPPPRAQVQERAAREAELERVAVTSFNDAQRLWARRLGERYREAKLVLFWDATRSGCGDAESAMGPFYCPADDRVYVDLGFYRELATRFGAPGAFAQAYVIAHEVGHHVQDVLGIERKVRAAQRDRPQARNALSVLMELQADCFAGVWGHAARQRGLLDPGDLEAGLAAAAAVGDDRIQKAATGRVSPESFTHGSSAQRVEWFRRGFESGDARSCDTFAPRR